MKTYEQFQEDKYNFAIWRVRSLSQFEQVRQENPELVRGLLEFDRTYGNERVELVQKVADEMLAAPLHEREKLRDEIFNRPEIRESRERYQRVYDEQDIGHKEYELYCLLKKHCVDEKEMGVLS